MQNILRMFLFVAFFSIGAAAMSVSVLCGDLLTYYTNKQLLKTAEVSLNRLKSLNDDYNALLEQLRDDPNFINRIAPATLGTQPRNTDAIYPKATMEQLAAAKKVLTEQTSRQLDQPMIPGWIIRCSESPQRTVLFLAGALLVLISFMCFGRRSAGQLDC